MSEQSSPSSATSSTLSAGEMLRQARERQQLSIEEIAAKLNLRPSLVNDMEENRYDHLQITAYRRGYLRAYARLMKIDDSEVIAAHDREHAHPEAYEPRKTQPIKPIKRPTRAGKFLFRLVTFFVVLALIIMTVNWWRGRQGVPEFAPTSTDHAAAPTFQQTPPTPAPAQTEPAPAETPAAVPAAQEHSLQMPVGQGVNGAKLTESEAASLSDTQQQPGTSDTSETVAAPEAKPHTLGLNFKEASWVEVRDAHNKPILSGLQPAGSQRELSGDAPYRLKIGNAHGVTLTYEGQPVELKKYTGNSNVARFSLGQ